MGAAFVGVEDEVVGGDGEGDGEGAEDVEGGLVSRRPVKPVSLRTRRGDSIPPTSFPIGYTTPPLATATSGCGHSQPGGLTLPIPCQADIDQVHPRGVSWGEVHDIVTAAMIDPSRPGSTSPHEKRLHRTNEILLSEST